MGEASFSHRTSSTDRAHQLCSHAKPTVALVYGALRCVTVGGFGEDVVSTAAVELRRAQRPAVVARAGASGGVASDRERKKKQNKKENRTFNTCCKRSEGEIPQKSIYWKKEKHQKCLGAGMKTDCEGSLAVWLSNNYLVFHLFTVLTIMRIFSLPHFLSTKFYIFLIVQLL